MKGIKSDEFTVTYLLSAIHAMIRSVHSVVVAAVAGMFSACDLAMTFLYDLESCFKVKGSSKKDVHTEGRRKGCVKNGQMWTWEGGVLATVDVHKLYHY